MRITNISITFAIVAAFCLGALFQNPIRDAWAGKGDIDAQALIDYSATAGTVYNLVFHDYESFTKAQWTSLTDASTDQATFDSAAGTVFSTWYSVRPTAHKVAAYNAFKEVRLAQ